MYVVRRQPEPLYGPAVLSHSVLIDQIVHWKTMHQDLMRSNPTSKTTVERLRASVLSRIAKRGRKADRKMLILSIRAFSGAVKVTMDGTERAKVKFPKAFKNLELDVGKVDGHWYLIRFPET